MTLALAGIAAGLAGCGAAAPPEPASPGSEPSGEKAGCKGEVGEKHACNGDMKKGDMKEGDATPSSPGAPSEKPAP